MAANDLQTIVQRMIDAGESEDNIATVIQHFKAQTPPPPPPVSATTDTAAGAPLAATSVLRTAGPGILQTAGRFAADHPRAVQKGIDAGSRVVTGALGAELGGVPGAVVGASLHGLTPTQAAIRETAGRLAGESPTVAKTAGRAQGIIEYGRSMGINLKPGDLVPTGETPALDAFAESQGARIPRLYGPDNKLISGPGTLATTAEDAPGLVSRTVGKAASALPWLQGAAAIGDLNRVVEPNRRDIGFMGIGPSVDVPGAQPPLLNDLASKIKSAFLSKLAALQQP